MSRDEHKAAIAAAAAEYERAVRALIAAARPAGSSEAFGRGLRKVESGALQVPRKLAAIVLREWRDHDDV